MPKIEESLKKAVVDLPPKEKDKLIFKLLRKDEKLAKKLFFELVSTDSVEQRRNNASNLITEYFDRIKKYSISDEGILSSLRTMSSQISEHLYTTKDKYGEITLKIQTLNELFSINAQRYNVDSYSLSTEKLFKYIVARLYNLAILIKAFHPDYYIDFQENLNTLADSIENQRGIDKYCKRKKFDLEWLRSCNIPDNIKELSKENSKATN